MASFHPLRYSRSIKCDAKTDENPARHIIRLSMMFMPQELESNNTGCNGKIGQGYTMRKLSLTDKLLNRKIILIAILSCLPIALLSHCQRKDSPLPAREAARNSVQAHGEVLIKHGQVIMEDRADILKECLALMQEGLTMMHDGEELMEDSATHHQGQMLFATGQMMKRECSNKMNKAAVKRMGKTMIETGHVIMGPKKPAGN